MRHCSTRPETFVSIRGGLVAQASTALDLHCIVDNFEDYDGDLV